MSPIKITKAQESAIERALASTGQRKGRGQLQSSELISAAQIAEERCRELGIPARARQGAEFIYTPGGGVPEFRYPHEIMATRARLVRRSLDWFLIYLERERKPSNTRAEADLYLLDRHEHYILSTLQRKGVYKKINEK